MFVFCPGWVGLSSSYEFWCSLDIFRAFSIPDFVTVMLSTMGLYKITNIISDNHIFLFVPLICKVDPWNTKKILSVVSVGMTLQTIVKTLYYFIFTCQMLAIPVLDLKFVYEMPKIRNIFLLFFSFYFFVCVFSRTLYVIYSYIRKRKIRYVFLDNTLNIDGTFLIF